MSRPTLDECREWLRREFQPDAADHARRNEPLPRIGPGQRIPNISPDGGGKGVCMQAGGHNKRPHVTSAQGVAMQRGRMPLEGTMTEVDFKRIRTDLAAAVVERRRLERDLGL